MLPERQLSQGHSVSIPLLSRYGTENFEQHYTFLPLRRAHVIVRCSQRNKNISTDLCLLFGFQLIPHPETISHSPLPLCSVLTYLPEVIWPKSISHKEGKIHFFESTNGTKSPFAILGYRILEQKHIYHNPWKYLVIELCSKSLCTLPCSFQSICNLKKKKKSSYLCRL